MNSSQQKWKDVEHSGSGHDRTSTKNHRGNCNIWALEWSSRITNTRGYVLLEAFVELDAVLVNVWNWYPFRGRGLGYIVDLAYINASLATRVAWQVSENYAHSDHSARKPKANCVWKRARPPPKGWSLENGNEKAATIIQGDLFTHFERNWSLFPYHHNNRRQTVVQNNHGCIKNGGEFGKTRCGVVLALDIKNAFNSTNWNRIKGALGDIHRWSRIFNEPVRKLPLRDDSLLQDGWGPQRMRRHSEGTIELGIGFPDVEYYV